MSFSKKRSVCAAGLALSLSLVGVGAMSPAVAANSTVSQSLSMQAPTNDEERFTLEDSETLKDGFVSEPRDVTVTEKSDDKIAKEGVRIDLVHNGETSSLSPDKWDFSEKETPGGESKYLYKYTVDSSNFEEDGQYKVVVYSHSDMNRSTSDLNYSFTLASEKPDIHITGVAENGQYQGTDKQINLYIRGTAPVKELEVKLNDVNVKTEESSSGQYTLTIPQSNAAQSLTVRALDEVGNEEIAEVNNFTINSSKLSLLINQRWFQVTAFVLVALVVASLVLVFTRSRKEILQSKEDDASSLRTILKGTDDEETMTHANSLHTGV